MLVICYSFLILVLIWFVVFEAFNVRAGLSVFKGYCQKVIVGKLRGKIV